MPVRRRLKGDTAHRAWSGVARLIDIKSGPLAARFLVHDLARLSMVISMFRERRLRQLAAHVLLAWLFALAAGIVNACALGPEPHQGTELAGHDQHAASSSIGPHSAPAGAHGDHSPDSDKTPCAKFCDEPAAGTQSFKQQTDPLTTVWLVTGPQNPPTVAATPRVGNTSAAALKAWPPPIPISIAFLRLTL